MIPIKDYYKSSRDKNSDTNLAYLNLYWTHYTYWVLKRLPTKVIYDTRSF